MKKKADALLLGKCLKEIWKCEPQSLLMASGLAFMEALIPLGASLLSAVLVDGLSTGADYKRMAVTAMIGVAILFAMNALRGRMYRCGLPHSEYCNDLVEWKFDEKNMEMDYMQLDSPSAAGIRAQVQNDYDWGCGAYYMIPQFQRCCSGIIGIIASALLLASVFFQSSFWKHWSVFLFLFYIGIVTWISVIIEQHTYAAKEALKKSYDACSSRSNYLLRGGITYREGKDIRIYKAQPVIKSALREKVRDSMVFAESRLELRAGLWDGAASGILMGSAYLFVVLRGLNGALTAGSVVLFATAIYRFTENMKVFSKSRSEIFMNARRMESSFAYLELPDLIKKNSRQIREEDAAGEIEFQNISFQYSGTAYPALKDVSLKLKPGQKIAVVGLNGSGKTTLVKLLCRMYDPDEGRILLNGVDIREYDYKSYMKLFSVVFQDFKLLALPVGENVAAARGYDSDRIEECLEKAGIGERIRKMERGIFTSLYRDIEEDGVEVSGGEAQKIALARALYKDAPFVVLDEPTAALDPISEHEIYSGFEKLVGEKAVIFISHRLSSCRFCDEIFVFHEGRLVQRGTHQELLSDPNGQYHKMWQAQARYYEDSGVAIG